LFVSSTEHEATQEDRCSGLITQGSYFGIISTPNYPAPYDNNETCLWSIQVRQGYYLRVSFKEFHLEEGLSVQGASITHATFNRSRVLCL